MITVTINGMMLAFDKPVTILDAARSAGIPIPTLCHHDSLKPYGGCRLCLVEVEKVSRLQTSCSQHISDGMVVWTETEKVIEARRAVLEFLLINHPLDCPQCDKAGECELQDLAAKYGPATGRFAEGKRKYPENLEDPLIVRTRERCILCSRCVRMCDDVQGASALSLTNRGSRSYIEPFSGGRFECEYCGNCLAVCPVGAITSRAHRHGYRPWMMDREVETICSYCGVGCSLVLQVRKNAVVRSIPKPSLGLNQGLLCSRGTFGYDCVNNAERLETPLLKKNGLLKSATWTEAIAHIAYRLKEIRRDHGSDAIGGIISGRCTNEDGYVFQKFFRGAVGTNNVDSSSSLAYAPAQRVFEKIFGQGVTANEIHGISNSDGIVVVGGDPTAVNPVLGLRVRAAFRKGAPVVVMGHAAGLKGFSTHMFVANPMTETILLVSLISELKKRKSPPGERPAFEKIIGGLPSVSLKDASERSGFSPEHLAETADTLARMSNPSIIIGKDIVHSGTGHMNLLLLASLAYLLNGRIYLLSELPNEQGLLDVGCQPDMLPSGRPLSVETFRRRCEETLGITLPSAPGLSYVGMIEAAHARKIKALYVVGEDMLQTLPGRNYVREALGNTEFLIVQDRFLTETARQADVVLPSPSWAEKGGTYTNLERRIQRIEKAVEGRATEEWQAVSEISRLLGLGMNYQGASDVFAEIARVSHIYTEISYGEIAKGKCIWPYRGGPLRHDMHIEGIELPDIAPLQRASDTARVFVRGESHPFYSTNASRYSPSLQSIAPEPCVKMGDRLADRLSIGDGEHAKISTDTGSLTLKARRDPHLPDDVVLIPLFEEEGIPEITKWKVNQATGAPALDDNWALISKMEEQTPSEGGRTEQSVER